MPDCDLLIVGARRDSIGAALADEMGGRGWSVITAGVSGDEDVMMPIQDDWRMAPIMDEIGWPRHVVVTVGINRPGNVLAENLWWDSMSSFQVNAVGPLRLFSIWAEGCLGLPGNAIRHFAIISSNSAQIARSNSTAYCMSKAALSMGIRCAGRDMAKLQYRDVAVYGYELGYVKGTPMSQEFEDNYEGGEGTHRIPGGQALSADQVAELIAANLQLPSFAVRPLNGCLLRIDGGEQ